MRYTIHACVVGAMIVIAAPASVLAQDAVLEEIVVTAQRRAQNVQDVPIAVTAFTGAELEKSNITGAVDYLARTPNVSFTEDGQSGSRGLGVAVRGVNNLVSGENAFINSIGIYLDEFSVASVPNQVANPFLPDMERVEVLRGPQGTLFGRNSLGGALNLTTRAPTDEVEGSIRIGGEGYDNAGEMFNIAGTLNLPVSDTFAVRGTLLYEDSSGLVENINPSGENDSGHEYMMARLRARWDLSDATTLDVTWIYSDEEQGTDENVPSGVLDLDTVDTLGITSAIDPGTGFWPDNRNELSHDLDEHNELESNVLVVKLTHAINDQLTLKWVTGLVDAEQERLFDNDLIGGVDVLSRDNLYEGQSWSTEFRLEGVNENVSWVAGILYAEGRSGTTEQCGGIVRPHSHNQRYRFSAAVPSRAGTGAKQQEFRGRVARSIRRSDLESERRTRRNRRCAVHQRRRDQRSGRVRHCAGRSAVASAHGRILRQLRKFRPPTRVCERILRRLRTPVRHPLSAARNHQRVRNDIERI